MESATSDGNQMALALQRRDGIFLTAGACTPIFVTEEETGFQLKLYPEQCQRCKRLEIARTTAAKTRFNRMRGE